MQFFKNIFFNISLVLAVLIGNIDNANASNTYRLMVFGDSLSAGYGVGPQNSFASLLEKTLHQKGYPHVVVINKSKSGETTAGGLNRLPQALKSAQPDGVILELGINDVLKGLSINEAEENLSKMITLCRQNKVSVLLVGMQAPPYAGIVYQRRFNKMYDRLADKYDLMLYPFFMKGLITLESITQGGSEYLLSDNVHPNVQGIQLMVNNILPFIEKFLKKNKIYPIKNRR